MCGLAGAILGKKRRRRDELRVIGGIVTELLILNETRGTDAGGVAVIRRDGSHKLLKRPGPASALAEDKLFHRVLELDSKVTAVLVHTRRKTRGSERNSLNNHPLRTGRVVGTHNGHLANADHLARTLCLPRLAEVDSEVLFRLVDRAGDKGEFLRLLRRCRGRIAAAFVCLDQPTTAFLLKGNMPLHAAHVPKLRAAFYASEPWMLDEALSGFSWRDLPLDPLTLSTFDTEDLLDFTQEDVSFRTPEATLWPTT